MEVALVLGAVVLMGWLILTSLGGGRSSPRQPPMLPPPGTHSPPVPVPQNAAALTTQDITAALQRRLGAQWLAEHERTREQLLTQEQRISGRLQQAVTSYNFEELKNLHRQSFQTADLVYEQLHQARSASGSITHALRNSSGSATDVLRRDKRAIDQFVLQFSADVKRLNRHTARLRDSIRDSCGMAGMSWYEALMARTAARREGRP